MSIRRSGMPSKPKSKAADKSVRSTRASPLVRLILPALQISAGRSCLLHVLHHFWPIVLVQSHRRIEFSRVAVRLADAEVEGAVVVGIRGLLPKNVETGVGH